MTKLISASTQLRQYKKLAPHHLATLKIRFILIIYYSGATPYKFSDTFRRYHPFICVKNCCNELYHYG